MSVGIGPAYWYSMPSTRRYVRSLHRDLLSFAWAALVVVCSPTLLGMRQLLSCAVFMEGCMLINSSRAAAVVTGVATTRGRPQDVSVVCFL